MAPSKQLHSLQKIEPILGKWHPSEDSIRILQPLVEKSLDTVTHLTEYEDEKANRIFAAMAFLSAFAAVMFAAVVEKRTLTSLLPWSPQWILLGACYGLFLLFGILLTVGSCLVLWAVRPRFNIPLKMKKTAPKTSPYSYLFFKGILSASPESWAQSFYQPASELSEAYVKNCVGETYLIAEKVRDKVKWLEPGVYCFFFSAVVFIPLVFAMIGALVLIADMPAEVRPGQFQQQRSTRQEGATTGPTVSSTSPSAERKEPPPKTMPQNDKAPEKK